MSLRAGFGHCLGMVELRPEHGHEKAGRTESITLTNRADALHQERMTHQIAESCILAITGFVAAVS
jgi:hypothetical protein